MPSGQDLGSLEAGGEDGVDNHALIAVVLPHIYHIFMLQNTLYYQISLNSSCWKMYRQYYLCFTEDETT